MPSIIYNEGRVVGLSAYEIYLRQHLSEVGDDVKPATEREWLASMIASGSAMLVKIPQGLPGSRSMLPNDWVYLDINFPSHSKLCAANTIVGYLFDGHGNYTGTSLFASSVASYGNLIENTSSAHPQATSTVLYPHIPVSSEPLHSREHIVELYSRIIDGIVVQPGTWEENQESSLPAYLLRPDMKRFGGIRLKIAGASDPFDADVEILLVGFTNRAVICGSSALDAANVSYTPSPDDGDFLGPASFPWAAKIQFVTPTYLSYLMNKRLTDAQGRISQLEDEIEDIPVINNTYKDIRLNGPGANTYSSQLRQAKDSMLTVSDGTNTYRVLALTGPTPEQDGTISFPLSDQLPVVNQPLSDSYKGYICWADLVRALRCAYLDNGTVKYTDGKIDTLTSLLRQFHNQLASNDNPDGMYVVNKQENTITLQPYVFSDDQIIKYRINLIPGPHYKWAQESDHSQGYQSWQFDQYVSQTETLKNQYYGWSNNGGSSQDTRATGPLFNDVKLDLFGYVSEYNNGQVNPTYPSDPPHSWNPADYYTRTLNMLGTLTLLAPQVPHKFNDVCDRWYQRFFLNDLFNIQSVLNVILSLRKGKLNTGLNSILFASGGRPLLITNSDSAWLGGCLAHMDLVMYINVQNIVSRFNEKDGNSNIKIEQITRCSEVSGELNHSIEGIIYARSYGNGWLSGSSVSSCSLSGSVGITEKKAGYLNNSGKINVTAKMSDGSSQTFDIDLTRSN